MEEFVCDIEFDTDTSLTTSLELKHLLKEYGLVNVSLLKRSEDKIIMKCIASKEAIDFFKKKIDGIIIDFTPYISNITVCIQKKKEKRYNVSKIVENDNKLLADVDKSKDDLYYCYVKFMTDITTIELEYFLKSYGLYDSQCVIYEMHPPKRIMFCIAKQSAIEIFEQDIKEILDSWNPDITSIKVYKRKKESCPELEGFEKIREFGINVINADDYFHYIKTKRYNTPQKPLRTIGDILDEIGLE